MKSVLAIGLLGVFVALAAMASTGKATFLLRILHQHPPADKVVHFLVAGLSCYLLLRVVHGVFPDLPRWADWTCIISCMALTSLEETLQMYFPSRTFSLADLAANLAGILCFGVWTCRSSKPLGERDV